MNQFQFLKQLNNIPGPGGDGVRVVQSLSMVSDVRPQASTLIDSTTGTADGTVVDVDAAFSQATLNNNFADLIQKINQIINNINGTALETNAKGQSSAAGTTSLASFTFTVPKDYDSRADEFKINCMARSAGNTDTPTLSATAYRKRAGAALTAALTVVASAAVPTLAVNAAERVVNLSGNALLPGDVLTVNLITSAHATDAVNVYGVEVQYKSGIVYTDPTAR